MSHWKQSAKDEVDFVTYKEYHDPIVDRLCLDSRVLVAYFPDVPDEVLGYVIYDKKTIHWLYVKKPYRSSGIANILLEEVFTQASPQFYSHRSHSDLPEKLNLKYNPYIVLLNNKVNL